METIAAVIGSYEWRNFVSVYMDDDYGRNGISAMSDALRNVRSEIYHKEALPPGASKNDIGSVLVQLALMESRIFVVHMNPDAGLNLFSEALYLGMLKNGYVWIATDWLSSALDSTILDYDTMNSLQGVISLRRHIPVSDQEHDFTVRWNNLHKAGSVDAFLNAFGFYAYNVVWAIAHSIHTFISEGGIVSFTDYPHVSSASGKKTKLAKLKVFGEVQNC
jgi:ionotropic glutamate receptor